MTDNVVAFGRHGQRGYFAAADIPQSPSVRDIAFGTGWWELDQIFKFYPGQFVVMSGIAGHGKSSLMLNILMRVARQHGIKSFLYGPENEKHIRERIRGIWGEQDGIDYFLENQLFLQSSSPEYYGAERHTLDWVLDKARFAIEKDKIELVVIDPWNELEYAKPRDVSMTDHIGQSLMLVKEFVRFFNCVVMIIAHPTKAVFDRGSSRVPGLADIEGSMNWYNKCDNGLIIWRDLGRNSCKVISAKVREIGAGKTGECYFAVDPATGIFTPQHGAVTP